MMELKERIEKLKVKLEKLDRDTRKNPDTVFHTPQGNKGMLKIVTEVGIAYKCQVLGHCGLRFDSMKEQDVANMEKNFN